MTASGGKRGAGKVACAETDSPPIDTPAKFRAARQKMGISQVRLGEALGRSERSIRDYETGQAEIDETLDLAMRYLVEHPPAP